jgi:hypothetical protein
VRWNVETDRLWKGYDACGSLQDLLDEGSFILSGLGRFMLSEGAEHSLRFRGGRVRKTGSFAYSCLTVIEEKPIRSAVVSAVCFSFCVYCVTPACFRCKYSVSELRYFTLSVVVYPPSYDITYSHYSATQYRDASMCFLTS